MTHQSQFIYPKFEANTTVRLKGDTHAKVRIVYLRWDTTHKEFQYFVRASIFSGSGTWISENTIEGEPSGFQTVR
jgi:hypothetical protein